MLSDTNLYTELMEIAVHGSTAYVIYAYPMSELILKPYCSRILTPKQVTFNRAMSSVRQAVEWGFGKIIIEFAFLDFRKNYLRFKVDSLSGSLILFLTLFTARNTYYKLV